MRSMMRSIAQMRLMKAPPPQRHASWIPWRTSWIPWRTQADQIEEQADQIEALQLALAQQKSTPWREIVGGIAGIAALVSISR
jgi:hypothetical protein